MVHANSLAAKLRLPKDDELLAGGDHFLDVMQIEPATDQRLAQRVRVCLLQRGLKDFLPAAKPPKRSFNDLPGQTNRLVTFLARKARKLMSIFVAPWIVSQQIFRRRDAKSPQRQDFRARNPIKFFE